MPDVIVVGAGVIGLACSWRLAQGGQRVLLLEAKRPGAGASGAALGSLIPASVLRDGPVPALQRESLARFEAFCREVEAVSGRATEFNRCGRLEIFGSPGRAVEARREVERAPSRLSWAPSPVQSVITPDAIAAVAPGVVAPHGGLWCAATAQVEPRSLLAALHEACVRAGVEVECGAPVDGLLIEHDRVIGVRQGDRRRVSRHVLAAAGACQPAFDERLARAAPVTPAKGVALLLRVRPLRCRAVVRSRSIYVMPRDASHVAVGATTEHQSHFEAEADELSIRQLRDGATEFWPLLRDSELVEAWVGLRPSSRSLCPYLGAVPGLPGLWVAMGHYKMGITLAPITAESLAHEIIHGTPLRDLSAFAPLSPG
ncbi:MAG: NAD(P)/FAD-dependent oxidoreductase [Planctomycetota bacterium]